MDFGEKIKNIRKEKKMTQEQMANILNVSRQAISNWENNKNFPDLEMIIKISRFFSLTLDELILGDDDTMTKKLIKDGSEVRLVKMNMITIIVASFLLLIGFGCLIVKGLSVEYVDSYGV
ncbi:helix-turn-helix domain-containing protein, partial [Clostridium perfringens]